jgi:hypothetical protein
MLVASYPSDFILFAVKLMPHANAVTKGNAKTLIFRPSDTFLFIKSMISGLDVLTHLFRQAVRHTSATGGQGRGEGRYFFCTKGWYFFCTKGWYFFCTKPWKRV